MKRFKYFQQMLQEGGDLPGNDPDPSIDPSANPDGNPDGGDEPSNNAPSWREKWAGEDEAKLKRISRYATEGDVLDALISAQDRIRKGELRAPFPSEGTEEEQAQWRKDNGLPEAPDKYDLTFDNGLVIGDDDKPFIDEYLKYAHQTNQTPEQVKTNLKWYYENLEKQQEARYEEDVRLSEETNEFLREEWGPEFKAHKNNIANFLNTIPEDVRDEFMNARH